MQFSIITASFKQLDWLHLCVASVRDQVAEKAEVTHFETSDPSFSVEHIIQDAGSPEIEEFAREVGADFYRGGKLISEGRRSHKSYFLQVHCEKDAGMYDAINRGLARSSGNICAWLNCDEQYLPGTLTKVAEIFRKDGALDVLLGDALLVNSRLNPVCYRRIMVPNRWHTQLDHLHSLSCAMFFRRSALPNPPLDIRWKVIGDAVLMDYFLSSQKHIRACGELLSAYAFTGQNLSADPTHGEHEAWLKYAKWPPRILRPWVVLQNRLRRMLHGAYQSFDVRTSLYTLESLTKRVSTNAMVSGKWPKGIL